MPAKEKYSLLDEDDDESGSTMLPSSSAKQASEATKQRKSQTNSPVQHKQSPSLKSIGIIVEETPGVPQILPLPPLSLDPAAPPTPAVEVPPPIQAVQVKAMKSKAVEQIQALLLKRRKKNKKNWKQNALLIAAVLSALAGVLFTIVGKYLNYFY